MRLFKLDKKIFLFKNNASAFLNGLTSNSMDAPQNAFLNLNGRIIATFDQIKLNEDEVVIAVENAFAPAMKEHLDRYVKLGGIKVQELNENIYFDIDGDCVLGQGERSVPQKKGKLILTVRELPVNVSDKEFTLFRLKNDIPWLGVDYKDEMLLNVSMKDFVSFTKGCYLGQEPVSKVYNRSKPTWRLVVRYKNECSDEEKQKMTSKTIDPENNQTLGFVFVSNK